MFMWWQLRLLTVALRGRPSSTVLLTRPVQFLFIHSCLGLNYFSTLILSGWELGRFNFIFHAGTAGAGYLLNYAAFPYFYQFGNSHWLLCPLQSLFSWDTADWRLLLFSGVQHGWHEPGHSVSPVWTLPCSTFLSYSQHFIIVLNGVSFIMIINYYSGKESVCQCRRCKRHWLDPWVRKMPWRRKWQPLQYSCWENSMDRGAWWLPSMGSQRVRHNWSTEHPQCQKLILFIPALLLQIPFLPSLLPL